MPTSPLVVVLLCVLCFRFPFFRPGDHGGGWLVDPTLPFADSGSDTVLAPLLRIEGPRVLLDGRRVGYGEEIETGGPHALDHLVADLDTLRRNWSILHPREPFPGGLNVSIARGTPWGRIRPVLIAAAEHRYDHLMLLVRTPPPEPHFDWSHFHGF